MAMKQTLKSLKKKAWDQFSIYIRQKYAKEGYVNCYTCGKNLHWKEAQAGHGIPGRNNAVLFLEEIVKPQCMQCNVFKHGALDIFTRKLIEEMGQEEYDVVARLAKDTVKFNMTDYRGIYELYKGKLENL